MAAWLVAGLAGIQGVRDQVDQAGPAKPYLHLRGQGKIDVIDQIHRTQYPGIENQKQPQTQVKKREGGFQAPQRVGPTYLIELIEGEI